MDRSKPILSLASPIAGTFATLRLQIRRYRHMSRISYTRRQVCQLGLSGLAGLTMLDLAACGNSTPTTTGNNSNPNVTLQLSFWGAASRNTLTEAAIKAYQ